MLTPIERTLLKAARRRLKNGDEQYICHALDYVSRRAQHRINAIDIDAEMGRRQVERRLKGYFMAQLDPFSCYESWYLSNYQNEDRMFPARIGYEKFARKCRQARIAWIDWILKEKP